MWMGFNFQSNKFMWKWYFLFFRLNEKFFLWGLKYGKSLKFLAHKYYALGIKFILF